MFVQCTNALLFCFFSRYANIDLKTQEAYELAVKGLLRPMEKSPPLITAIRCLEFAPPEFQLGRDDFGLCKCCESILHHECDKK